MPRPYLPWLPSASLLILRLEGALGVGDFGTLIASNL